MREIFFFNVSKFTKPCVLSNEFTIKKPPDVKKKIISIVVCLNIEIFIKNTVSRQGFPLLIYIAEVVW